MNDGAPHCEVHIRFATFRNRVEIVRFSLHDLSSRFAPRIERPGMSG
jgi:hypothetical protein